MHAQVGHPVQGGTANQHLEGLSVKGAATETVAQGDFEAQHLRFSQRATVITHVAFPLRAVELTDAAQVFIVRVSLNSAFFDDRGYSEPLHDFSLWPSQAGDTE